jgi:hypothetical protein
VTSVAENEISGEAVKAFQHDGYAVFRSVLDQDLINEVNGHVVQIVGSSGWV